MHDTYYTYKLFSPPHDHVALAEAALLHHFVTSFIGPSWHYHLLYIKKKAFLNQFVTWSVQAGAMNNTQDVADTLLHVTTHITEY